MKQVSVYTRRKVSDLRAEAQRLITAGEMPSLDEVLSVVSEIRAKYRPLIFGRQKGEDRGRL
jgi:hypothetical protein